MQIKTSKSREGAESISLKDAEHSGGGGEMCCEIFQDFFLRYSRGMI